LLPHYARAMPCRQIIGIDSKRAQVQQVGDSAINSRPLLPLRIDVSAQHAAHVGRHALFLSQLSQLPQQVVELV